MNYFYKLARTALDYRSCHVLLREAGIDAKLTFPTVMAVREGELVGLYGTVPHADVIIAGPLFVKEGAAKGMTAIKLIEAYENVLRAAGVTSYMFYVDKKNTKMVRMGRKLFGEPHSSDRSVVWFWRNLDGQQAKSA